MEGVFLLRGVVCRGRAGLCLVIDGFKAAAERLARTTALHRHVGLRRLLDGAAGTLVWFLALFFLLTRISGVPDDDDAAEFYLLCSGPCWACA